MCAAKRHVFHSLSEPAPHFFMIPYYLFPICLSCFLTRKKRGTCEVPRFGAFSAADQYMPPPMPGFAGALPVNSVTALVGAPVVASVLFRKRKNELNE